MSPKTHLVDTTAMGKNVAYPMETNLLDCGGDKLHLDEKKPCFRRLQRRRAGIEPV
ncbi:MAG: hypothetical protein FJZ00_08780, partial [Candidatus Sericytochromatia bacterium]|nr:hypothetical protein [Candidatus Tanganyikabacteria bacterium]